MMYELDRIGLVTFEIFSKTGFHIEKAANSRYEKAGMEGRGD